MIKETTRCMGDIPCTCAKLCECKGWCCNPASMTMPALKALYCYLVREREHAQRAAVMNECGQSKSVAECLDELLSFNPMIVWGYLHASMMFDDITEHVEDCKRYIAALKEFFIVYELRRFLPDVAEYEQGLRIKLACM